MNKCPSTVPAIYARVSSEQQAEAATIDSQVDALQGRIAADGLTLETEMRFLDEGYSGATLIRPALERLRDVAATGAIDRLYVHSPDRLAEVRLSGLAVGRIATLRRGSDLPQSSVGADTRRRSPAASARHGRGIRTRQDPRTKPPRETTCCASRLGQCSQQRAVRLSLRECSRRRRRSALRDRSRRGARDTTDVRVGWA